MELTHFVHFLGVCLYPLLTDSNRHIWQLAPTFFTINFQPIFMEFYTHYEDYPENRHVMKFGD